MNTIKNSTTEGNIYFVGMNSISSGGGYVGPTPPCNTITPHNNAIPHNTVIYHGTLTGGGTSATTGIKKECNWCSRKVDGGIYISNVFYCPMCASIINKNNQPLPGGHGSGGGPSPINYLPKECDSCPNNPKNGGTGVCHCIIGIPKVT